MSITQSTLKTAVAAIKKVFPLELADRSWDNVGLLVDSASPDESFSDSASTSASNPYKILLTVDLTRSVCKEAIAQNSNLIVAYHPFIFRGIKSVGSSDPQHVSLVELIKHSISVYSPHTSVDSVKGGVNDWLVNCVAGEIMVRSSVPIEGADSDGNGMGRFVQLDNSLSLDIAIDNVKKILKLQHVQVAKAATSINTIAVCAGSGGGVFAKYLKGGELPDLLLTGELSHHEILAFKERGVSVILCNHSNTERGYLKVMKELLTKELSGQLKQLEIEISKSDADPLCVV